MIILTFNVDIILEKVTLTISVSTVAVKGSVISTLTINTINVCHYSYLSIKTKTNTTAMSQAWWKMHVLTTK